MSSNQRLAYRALRATLPPSTAKWFALNRRFAVCHRPLLPAVIYPNPVRAIA